jgi:hypothetical protein
MAGNLLIPFYLSGLDSNPSTSNVCPTAPDGPFKYISCSTCLRDDNQWAITFNCYYIPEAINWQMLKIEKATSGAGYTICGNRWNTCLTTGDTISGKTTMGWKQPSEASHFKFVGVSRSINGILSSNGRLEVSGNKLYSIQLGNQCLEAHGVEFNLTLADCVNGTPDDAATSKQLFIVPDSSGKIREDLDVTSSTGTTDGTSTGNGSGSDSSTGNTYGTDIPSGASTKLGWSMSVLISLFL